MNYALSASTFFPLTKNLSIHGGLRIGLSHIHAAKVTVLTHYANNEELTIYSQNALPYRIQLQPNFGPMLGLDYSINHGTLSVGISYLNYFKTTVDPQGRYKDLDFNITTGYVNDAIRMRLWGINLSYQKTLNFRVKKKPY